MSSRHSTAIIIGAGASFACANSSNPAILKEWTPPLATDLFNARDKEQIGQILAKYPHARYAAATLQAKAAYGTLDLEEELRQVFDSSGAIEKMEYEHVVLYIWERLALTSHKYCSLPGNYIALLREIRNFGKGVILINLNYDTLLDGCVEEMAPSWRPHSVDHYSNEIAELNIAGYFKPHGSVNWFHRRAVSKNVMRRPGSPEWLFGPPDNESFELEKTTSLKRNHFPAITAPRTGKTSADIRLPKHSAERLSQLASACKRIITIGTSCVDAHILSLFHPRTESDIGVQKIHITDMATPANESVVRSTLSDRMACAVRDLDSVDVQFHLRGFESFIANNLLREALIDND